MSEPSPLEQKSNHLLWPTSQSTPFHQGAHACLRVSCFLPGRTENPAVKCLATTAKGHELCHSRQIQMKRACCPVLEAGWVVTGVYGDIKSNLEGFLFISNVKCCIWRVTNMYALEKMKDFSRWNFHPDIDDMVKSFEIWKHHLRKKGLNKRERK